jgi:putative membrane protein
MLQFLLPWDFSPTVVGTVFVLALLFVRGAVRLRTPARQWFLFFLGLTLVYAALQTQWDYYAGHMFFVHRLQHLVLHDLGPFLLAWSAPVAVLAQGLPQALRAKLEAWCNSPRMRRVRHFIFDPWTATVLFVASLCVWVWPTVHFYAMLSNWVYRLMNWSVIIIDLPFWWIVLDPRPSPQARLSYGKRILMLVLVMMPMIAVGAVIGLSRHDLYPVYQLCGRFLPISPITDQQIGGLIIWIPGSLLAAFAALIALARVLEHSRRQELALHGSGVGMAAGRP